MPKGQQRKIKGAICNVELNVMRHAVFCLAFLKGLK